MSDIHAALVQQIEAKTETFQEILDAVDAGSQRNGQEPEEALNEVPLEVNITRKITMVLCTGGPRVEVTADLEDTGELSDVTIHGWWSGSSTEHKVDPDSPIRRALGWYIEGILI